MFVAVAVTLIGTPRGEPALLGVSWRGDGTALRATSSKLRVWPAGIGVARYWSHSTPPALSTESPTTVLSNVR